MPTLLDRLDNPEFLSLVREVTQEACFSTVRDHLDKIVWVKKAKHDASDIQVYGGKVVEVKAIPTLYTHIIDRTSHDDICRAVIQIDGYTWDKADTPIAKRTILHRALSFLEVEATDTDDRCGIKFKIRKPDVCEFSQTLMSRNITLAETSISSTWVPIREVLLSLPLPIGIAGTSIQNGVAVEATEPAEEEEIPAARRRPSRSEVIEEGEEE